MIALVLLLIVSLTVAFVDKPCSASRASATRLQLYNSVEAAIDDAQRICAANPNSPECKVAWDIVEELEAADSHRGVAAPPEALSLSAEYASLVQSYDILRLKTERKMDQLKSLIMRMEELGVTDVTVARLANLSDEMKFALTEAQASLDMYE